MRVFRRFFLSSAEDEVGFVLFFAAFSVVVFAGALDAVEAGALPAVLAGLGAMSDGNVAERRGGALAVVVVEEKDGDE